MRPGTTDKTIEDAVMRELEWDPEVNATHIAVSAKDGAVGSHRPVEHGEVMADLRPLPAVGAVRAPQLDPLGRRPHGPRHLGPLNSPRPT